MRTVKFSATTISIMLAAVVAGAVPALGQDRLPESDDSVMGDYYTSPRYRESESHPLRVLAYVVHPVGWVLRELIFRPLSYFAGSTPETKSIMGYREPFDFRTPSCFKGDDSVPDCHTVKPFDYNQPTAYEPEDERVVYFPDVNFDFDKRALNKLGKARAHEVAELIKKDGGVQVVLEGNTDSRGSEAYNEKLGMDRAKAVKAELARQGVPADSMTTVSFGESRPLFAEKEEWAYAANRRVAARLQGQGSPLMRD
jgi:outer membrane protein OmpA-like peptidoglycan-associated protein